MHKGTVLVIDDDPEMRDSLQSLLKSDGFEVALQSDATNCVNFLKSNSVDAILSDVRMPGISGMELLEQLKHANDIPLVLMSAHADVSMAVEAMQNGAANFVEKPFDPKHLLQILKNSCETGQLKKREKRLVERLTKLSGLDQILLGNSPSIVKLREDIANIADSNVNVLIIGETGTGKELVARAIHDLSQRSSHEFVTMNCSTAANEQSATTLFGDSMKAGGLLNQANLGTLYLDEIVSMPMDFQPQMLRAIESQEYLPVGSDQVQTSDFRVLASTKEELEPIASQGGFRSDLLHRINTFELKLPPLRDRGEDITFLYSHFINRFSDLYEIEPPTTSADDLSTLMTHDWAGNVRELRNVCERQVLLSRQRKTPVSDAISHGKDMAKVPDTLREAVAAFERQLIAKSLRDNEGRMDDTADKLGIGRRTLNEKIVKLGLDKDSILSR